MIISSFKQVAAMEANILTGLNVLSSSQQPFPVVVDGFGGLPTHSLYIAIATKVQIQDLVKKTRSAISRFVERADVDLFMGKQPHFLVADQLDPSQYHAAWKRYSNKTFKGAFIANEMVLLRRADHQVDWQPVHIFPFQKICEAK